MSARNKLISAINKFGRGVSILRDAGNITEKHLIVTGFGHEVERSPFPQEISYFKWDSQVRLGDICQDALTGNRKIIYSFEYLGLNGSKDGIRLIGIQCNDAIVLYELVPTVAVDSFGKKNYNPTVRVNDFASVVHNVQGDSLAPIGEVDKSEVIIIFSARKLGAYVPKQGNRLVTLDGSKYQIDGLDSHVYPGSYRALCTPDQRIE